MYEADTYIVVASSNMIHKAVQKIRGMPVRGGRSRTGSKKEIKHIIRLWTNMVDKSII